MYPKYSTRQLVLAIGGVMSKQGHWYFFLVTEKCIRLGLKNVNDSLIIQFHRINSF